MRMQSTLCNGQYSYAQPFHYTIIPTFLFLILFSFSVRADTHYVNKVNGSPVSPFTNGWSSAADNIQTAINVSAIGDLILVANGVYDTGGSSGSRVYLPNAQNITVQAVSTNPANTLIVGAPDTTGGAPSNSPTSLRCAYVGNGCMLAGFTLTNGYAPIIGVNYANNSGGGVRGQSIGQGTVSNCVIVGCQTVAGGGGACYGLLLNCIVRNCVADSGGGCRASLAANCLFANNYASGSYAGGGVFLTGGETFSNCTIAGNTGNLYGGGVGANGVGSPTVFNKCIISGNSASYGGGACTWPSPGMLLFAGCVFRDNLPGNGGGAATGGGGGHIMRNCLIVNNGTTTNTGTVVSGGILVNCTVVSNFTKTGSGAVNLGVTNCIVYGNIPCDIVNLSIESNCYYSCLGLNAAGTNRVAGNSNLYNVFPQFVSSQVGDYHLQNISPCINRGTNQDWMTNSVDVGGLRRIVDGTVDMGAYEFLPRGTIVTILGNPAP